MADLSLPRQTETLSCVGFVTKLLRISFCNVDSRGGPELVLLR